MKDLLRFALVSCFLFGYWVQSTAQFTLSGEFRPRTEFRHGYKNLPATDQDAAFFIDQRTRLNLDYKAKSYRFYVSLQDVRVWGSQSQLVANDGALTSLHQAFGEVMFNDKLSMKAGRQEIAYDDHRIFGSVGWAQQARSHDALIFKVKNGAFKADLGLAYNQNGAGLAGTTYTVPNSYKTFQFLWLHNKWDKIAASVLLLNNGKEIQTEEGGTNYSQTIGTRTGYADDKLKAFISLYYQGGELPNAEDGREISATLLGLDVLFKATDNVSLGLGYERQSGNDMVNPDDEFQAFTPFYGTNHKFNGFMDYFYVGNHVGSVGLQDIYLKLKYKKNKFNGGIDAHYFTSAADVADEKGGSMDAGLGTEVDLYLGTNLAEGVAFKMGYSQMFGTETLQALRGGDTDETANWAWMMVVIKPTLFTTAK